MRRLILFVALAALIVALPATHDVFAKKMPKVKICHVNSSNSAGLLDFKFLPNVISFNFGRVISVDASAVDAHVAHGDRAKYFFTPDSKHIGHWAITCPKTWDKYVDWAQSLEDMKPVFFFDNTNAVVKNANCSWISIEKLP